MLDSVPLRLGEGWVAVWTRVCQFACRVHRVRNSGRRYRESNLQLPYHLLPSTVLPNWQLYEQGFSGETLHACAASIKALLLFLVASTEQQQAAEEEHIRSAAGSLPFIHTGDTGGKKVPRLNSILYSSISIFFSCFVTQNGPKMCQCLRPPNSKTGSTGRCSSCTLWEFIIFWSPIQCLYYFRTF